MAIREGLRPRELLGGLYEKIYPPMQANEARQVLEGFAALAARDVTSFKKAGDESGAEAARERAKRFRTLADKDVLREEDWLEIRPWIERAVERSLEEFRAASRDAKKKKNATARLRDLERLREFLEKKRSKAA